MMSLSNESWSHTEIVSAKEATWRKKGREIPWLLFLLLHNLLPVSLVSWAQSEANHPGGWAGEEEEWIWEKTDWGLQLALRCRNQMCVTSLGVWCRWQSTCLASMRPWVQTPVMPKQKKQMCITVVGHWDLGLSNPSKSWLIHTFTNK
jgi:hypothetical protein